MDGKSTVAVMEGADDNQPRVEGGGQVAKGLIAGAVSGLTSRAFVYPFDTLKSQLYVQGAVKGLAPHISLTGAFRKVCCSAAKPCACRSCRIPIFSWLRALRKRESRLDRMRALMGHLKLSWHLAFATFFPP